MTDKEYVTRPELKESLEHAGELTKIHLSTSYKELRDLIDELVKNTHPDIIYKDVILRLRSWALGILVTFLISILASSALMFNKFNNDWIRFNEGAKIAAANKKKIETMDAHIKKEMMVEEEIHQILKWYRHERKLMEQNAVTTTEDLKALKKRVELLLEDLGSLEQQYIRLKREIRK